MDRQKKALQIAAVVFTIGFIMGGIVVAFVWAVTT